MDDESVVRIVIADDHQLFREGLRRLLESEPGFLVVGEAADGLAAAQVVRETTPDVLLLDVAMPRVGGVETLPFVPDTTRVILLTAGIDPADLLRSIQSGARGVVLKESATQRLVQAIRQVMTGHYVMGNGAVDDLAQAVKQARAAPERRYSLTGRELEVVAAIVAGDSNREISERLSISAQTVKHHLTSIFDKTGTSSRLELAMFAIRQDLVEHD